MQERLQARRRQLIASSLGEYALQFEEFIPALLLDELSGTRRERHFGNRSTFWAWLSQVMDENASCSKAVGLVQAWCAEAGLAPPSSQTGAYCKARHRLPMSMLEGVLGHLDAMMKRRVQAADLWQGHMLKAIDGSSLRLLDTAANQEAYPQPCAQKPGCGFPVMGILGVCNLSHGGWEAFATAPATEHDHSLAAHLLEHFNGGDLVLADRAFCSYELIARLRERGAHCLMRLHQARERHLDWKHAGVRLGPHERLVEWRRPAGPPPGSSLSLQQWEALPGHLTLRLVRQRCAGRDGEPRDLILVTTLTAADEHSGADVAALYQQRWQIELKLRDLKTTLGMEELAVKTPAMAHKTLAMLMIGYNLIKALSQRAAHQAGRGVGDLAFKGVLDLVVAYRGNYRGHRRHEHKRAALHQSLLEIIASKLIHERPGRREPRAVKRRSKPFPLLTSPRHSFREIQHRSRYRASA